MHQGGCECAFDMCLTAASPQYYFYIILVSGQNHLKYFSRQYQHCTFGNYNFSVDLKSRH